MRDLLAALLLLSTASGVSHAQPDGAPGDLPPAAFADRWIGQREGPSCPAAPGWTVTEPFGDLVAPGAEILSTTCRYAWSGQGPVVPESLPPEAGRAQWLVRESWAIRPHSTDLSDHLAGELYTNWRLGSGSSTLTPLPAPSGPIARPLVAVIDSCTATGGCADSGATRHGYLVKQVIEDITHPAGSVDLADLVTERAIGSVFDGTRARELADGGAFGTHGDLAQAIVRAVDGWRGAGVARPLIINLSLGWQNKYGAAADGGPTLPTSAYVAAALRYARCHGALIFAATGNRTLDDDDAGMLLPAAWTSLNAPTEGMCPLVVGDLAFGPSWQPVPPPLGPLVYAVTASDAQGNLLGTVRHGSAANFRAPGAQIVTRDGGAYTKAFSGASAATAIVSGAAAVLWAYRPDLNASEIAEQLFASGTSRGIAYRGAMATSGLMSLFDSVSVDLCGALHDACGAPAGMCPASLPACVPLPESVVELDASYDDWSGEVVWDDVADATVVSVDTVCGLALHLAGVPVVGLRCPFEIPTQTAEAHVWPQPVLPLCDTCAWIGSDVVMKMRPDLPHALEDAEVTVIDKYGHPARGIKLKAFGLGTLKAGEAYRVESIVSLGAGETAVLGGYMKHAGKTVAVLEDLEELK